MKKRTGKMISLSLAVAMAMTAAPVTALAVDEPVLTTAQNAGETGTDTTTVDTETGEGTAWAELRPAEKVGEKKALNALPAEEVVEEVEEVADAPTYEENETISIKSSEDLVNAIKNQKDGQTWILEGDDTYTNIYNLTDGFTLPEGTTINGSSGPFAFPIYVDGLTIKTDKAHKALITSDYDPNSGNWHSQNFITISGSNVTIDGVDLQGNANGYYDGQCNKVIELVDGAQDFTLKNSNFETREDNNGKVSSGSIYINVKNPGNVVIENVTLQSWINARNVTEGNVTVTDVTMDFRNNSYAGYFDETYGYAWNPAVSGDSNHITLENFTVQVDAGTNLQEQLFTDQLKEGTVVELCGKFEDPIGITKSNATVPVTLKAGENNDISAMTIMNADNITLEGLNFTSASTENNLDTNPSALYVQNASGIKVDNCTFDGTAIDGTAVAIATAAGTEDFTVENSTIKDFVMSGYHNTGADITYDNNKFENIKSGVAFDGTNGITVTENTFDNANGIRLRPYGETKCENVTVTENSFNSVNTSSPYGHYAVMTKESGEDGKDGVVNVDLSGNYWGGADSVDAIKDMIISNADQNVSIDTFYKTPEDLEAGNETVVTTETGIKVNGTWYKTENELKELIDNGIPDNTVIEVYGKVDIPYQKFTTNKTLGTTTIVEGYLVIPGKNVTIEGKTPNATLYSSSEPIVNGSIGTQSFISMDSGTLKNVTIMPHSQKDKNDPSITGLTNKTIEVWGKDFTMTGCTVIPNDAQKTNDGGSLYFNGDKGTVLVEDCTFDNVTLCFDSVKEASGGISIKDNTFVSPGNPYTIGNTSWTTPVTNVMAPITIEGNSFNDVTEDTTLVLQRMEGNFILTDNTVDNGKSIADFVDFDTDAIDTSVDDKMHITITENGKTVQLTPSNEEGQDPTAKEFKLNATSLSTKVGRSVTLTATFDNAGVAADWAVDGKEAATDKTSFEFTPNTKGTYTVTATYVQDDVTYTATCEVTAKSSSSGSHSYDGYITIINPKNGEVSVSDDWANEDEKITLTITPDKGYVVDKIEIVDAEGDKIDAKKAEDKDDKYTFRMANCDVTVTVTFKEEGKTTEDTDKEEDKDDEETTELNFTDVKESDWFYKGVAYVVDKGVMSGVSENQFDPSGKLTRAMLVQMLYNMESRPACDAENAFIDVPVGQWYTDAVIWANDEKIVSGMGDGLFAPNMEITREQMVVMLYNYAKYKGYDVTASADLSKFADNASVSTWAQPAMQWAVAEGYISGMGDNQLAPHGTATRAEIASVIMRFMEATAESAETAE